jgi:glycosyltransferase involved in cell wall biosynthesis
MKADRDASLVMDKLMIAVWRRGKADDKVCRRPPQQSSYMSPMTRPSMEQKDQDAVLRMSEIFDAAWYCAQYADIAQSGMEPFEHYLKVGRLMGRDPGPGFSEVFVRHAAARPLAEGETAGQRLLSQEGPDILPDRVMLGAAALSRRGRREDAIRLARDHLGPAAERTIRLLLANIAILSGNEGQWLEHLNAYLEPYGIERVCLRPGPSLLHRLLTAATPQISGGPMVSVIMPAYQAATYLEPAANSILQQSWTNLELLIVDDGSTDGTWSQMQDLAVRDSRVRIRRNPCNRGPYVAKNLALQEARGDFVTGQDADDWAHPRRIERQVTKLIESQGSIRAGTGMMVRVSPGGLFDDVIGASPHHSPDGFRRRAFISCMFDKRCLQEEIGYFDPVRFGADGEMLQRAKKILGEGFRDFDVFTMLCLDLQTGLTNHPAFGLKTIAGVSAVRRAYNASWQEWHRNTPAEDLFNPYPLGPRMFEAPEDILVDLASAG